jgi:cytoskeletal protein RodZ
MDEKKSEKVGVKSIGAMLGIIVAASLMLNYVQTGTTPIDNVDFSSLGDSSNVSEHSINGYSINTSPKSTSDTDSYSSNSYSDSYSSQTVTCPSCHRQVSRLIKRETIKGHGDWQRWCQSCWDNYESLSPYANSTDTAYDKALSDVSKATGISEQELDAAYRAKYGN